MQAKYRLQVTCAFFKFIYIHVTTERLPKALSVPGDRCLAHNQFYLNHLFFQ
jgi:hypothetical protein